MPVRKMANLLPPLNFLTLHHAYFIVMGLAWSLIFWAIATPNQSVSYIDSLFLCVSAMTGAGLNTVCLSEYFVLVYFKLIFPGQFINCQLFSTSYSLCPHFAGSPYSYFEHRSLRPKACFRNQVS
jgi:hypothetical protein